MFTPENIDDYKNKITEKQTNELINHCNKYKIEPVIVAWYDDIEDLINDYKLHCDYGRETTMTLYESEADMFCDFSNREIVKLAK